MRKLDFEQRSIFSVAYWKDAVSYLGDIRMLCVAAVFVALRVAMKSLYIPIGENINVYFGYLVNALGGMIYGPVVAAVSAAASDTVGALVAQSAQGPYFFPFIFVEIAGSVLYSVFLWKRKASATRIILSRFTVTFICNILINPAVMIWYYKFLNNGKSYAFITIPRVVKNVATFPIEAFFLTLFIGAMLPVLVRMGLASKEQHKPQLTAKHYVILGLLFLVACASTALYYFVYLPNK